jgi:hypothetical protein
MKSIDMRLVASESGGVEKSPYITWKRSKEEMIATLASSSFETARSEPVARLYVVEALR